MWPTFRHRRQRVGWRHSDLRWPWTRQLKHLPRSAGGSAP
uniref:Uncharacterized protein n=1 Tax=Arundo donax TaxID=35708 RepID=A0A0A8Y9G8_ARUDO